MFIKREKKRSVVCSKWEREKSKDTNEKNPEKKKKKKKKETGKEKPFFINLSSSIFNYSSMNKLSSKPISSPNRSLEKFPPPLMRFLKTNGGSRSKGRSSSSSSRSSPMFVRKSNRIETQEPSSPKVTCMGQVRVRRSKQQTVVSNCSCSSSSSCRWIRKALICNKCFSGKSKPRFCFPVWSKIWCFGFKSKVEIVEESVKTESRRQFTVKYEEEEEENPREEEEEEEKEERVFEAFDSSTSSSSPPKNALLLMRCRSDPCRNRFWGSPSVITDEEKTKLRNKIHIENKEEEEDEEIPKLEKESICIESRKSDPEMEEKLGFCEGFENSSINGGRKSRKIKEEEMLKENGGSFSSSTTTTTSSIPPLALTRCKSEPSSRGLVKVMESSESCYWNKRKSGFDEKCPPQILLLL